MGDEKGTDRVVIPDSSEEIQLSQRSRTGKKHRITERVVAETKGSTSQEQHGPVLHGDINGGNEHFAEYNARVQQEPKSRRQKAVPLARGEKRGRVEHDSQVVAHGKQRRPKKVWGVDVTSDSEEYKAQKQMEVEHWKPACRDRYSKPVERFDPTATSTKRSVEVPLVVEAEVVGRATRARRGVDHFDPCWVPNQPRDARKRQASSQASPVYAPPIVSKRCRTAVTESGAANGGNGEVIVSRKRKGSQAAPEADAPQVARRSKVTAERKVTSPKDSELDGAVVVHGAVAANHIVAGLNHVSPADTPAATVSMQNSDVDSDGGIGNTVDIAGGDSAPDTPLPLDSYPVDLGVNLVPIDNPMDISPALDAGMLVDTARVNNPPMVNGEVPIITDRLVDIKDIVGAESNDVPGLPALMAMDAGEAKANIGVAAGVMKALSGGEGKDAGDAPINNKVDTQALAEGGDNMPVAGDRAAPPPPLAIAPPLAPAVQEPAGTEKALAAKVVARSSPCPPWKKQIRQRSWPLPKDGMAAAFPIAGSADADDAHHPPLVAAPPPPPMPIAKPLAPAAAEMAARSSACVWQKQLRQRCWPLPKDRISPAFPIGTGSPEVDCIYHPPLATIDTQAAALSNPGASAAVIEAPAGLVVDTPALDIAPAEELE